MVSTASRFRRVALAAAGALGLLAASPLVSGAAAPTPSQTASLAAWQKIVAVLQHPRCLNCHQAESPLQGDARQPHVPRVVRGPDNLGVGAARCGNCHNDTGNDAASRAPGAPHWQLAPVSMIWQGRSDGDLCRLLKDPKRNGNRSLGALVEHMDSEPLVLWGWNPGADRAPVPMPHQEFVAQMKVWAVGGAVCPR
jgi:mono/diheme cytochrome c family protein